MNIIEAIENRRSIRTFKPDPIPDGILEKIIKTAGRSPSYTNTQPWEIAVVRGKTRDDLSRNLYNAASSDTPITPDIPKPSTWPEELDRRSKEHGERRFKVLGIERDDAVKRKDLRLQNFKFYGAPAVLFIFIDKGLSEWSVMDIGMFAQSIMITALEYGLGTCPQAVLTNYPRIVKRHLNIPESKRLALGISIGYPDNEALINSYRSARVEIEKFTSWY
ncbi:MAG: nitroreductase [Nitrospinae bacterium]|nr:nitroreductase [Nitrospinota bacterium]